jgi:hypothetical protein
VGVLGFWKLSFTYRPGSCMISFTTPRMYPLRSAKSRLRSRAGAFLWWVCALNWRLIWLEYCASAGYTTYDGVRAPLCPDNATHLCSARKDHQQMFIQRGPTTSSQSDVLWQIICVWRCPGILSDASPRLWTHSHCQGCLEGRC